VVYLVACVEGGVGVGQLEISDLLCESAIKTIRKTIKYEIKKVE
jgi:hypothetical protein